MHTTAAHCILCDHATSVNTDSLVVSLFFRRPKSQIPPKPPDSAPANCMVMADGELHSSSLVRELLRMKEAYGTDQDPPSHNADGEPVPLFSFWQLYASLLKPAVLKDLIQHKCTQKSRVAKQFRTAANPPCPNFKMNSPPTWLAIMQAYPNQSRGNLSCMRATFLAHHIQ